MAKFVKLLLIIALSLVGIFAIAAVAVWLFFDPNDYRDTIAAKVEEATGRELTIEGEVSLSLFPWIAIEVGRTRLANEQGFGEEPLASFENARLSVELLPLVFERAISVGTASLEGLDANLAMAADGRTNWQGITESLAEETPGQPAEDEGTSISVEQDFVLDINDVVISDARISYRDAQTDSDYVLENVNLSTGPVAIGEPFDINGAFDFSARPAEVAGRIELAGGVTVSPDLARFDIDGLGVAGTVTGLVDNPAEIRLDARSLSIDTEREVIDAGEIDLAALGLAITATVEPVSYAGDPTVQAEIRVADFSLKALLERLGIEPPETVDPNALTTVSFEADAAADAERIALSDLRLVLDGTTMTGTLAVPVAEGEQLAFDLRADSINLDNYMAPPGDAPAEEEAEADPEIPVDLVRTLEASGTLRLDEAFVGPVRFTDMQLGVNAGDGKLRLHPITADFFDGSYAGDVRIDATAAEPVLSTNERIENVDIAAMLESMYDITDVTGTINATFALGGTGRMMSKLLADLDGNMRFELLDGTWEGVDLWHRLRSARALFKREEAPPAPADPETKFTRVTIAGQVIDGTYASDNLLAELPFLRVTGGGTVDLAAREIDYSVQARVLETPELRDVASEEELADFTQALIPIRIRGPLSEPTFRPDIEGIFRQEVDRALDRKKDELREELLDRLLGEDDAAEEGSDEAGQQLNPEEKDLEDELKDRLRDLFPR